MTIYNYMIPVYALLVKGGKYAITADGNTGNLPVVPAVYQEPVAAYLAKQVA